MREEDRLEPTLALRPRDVRAYAREGGAPADDVRVVAGPRRRTVREDDERLEEVRLARAVRPDEHRRPFADRQIELSV